MSRFLNTRGRASLGVALCGRCQSKFPIGDLRADPNAPGLMVCKADLDERDPYQLAPGASEDISLRFVRPDVALTF